MRIHELKPTHKLRRKKRIGRGGKRGTYSGKGMKGQKSRAGHKIKPMERELVMRIPKLRGVKFKPGSPAVGLKIGAVERAFGSGERITPRALVEKGILKTMGGVIPPVKLLGEGEVTKALLVEGCQVSGQAKKKITEAGGTIKE